jgi:hypothetical protein
MALRMLARDGYYLSTAGAVRTADGDHVAMLSGRTYRWLSDAGFVAYDKSTGAGAQLRITTAGRAALDRAWRGRRGDRSLFSALMETGAAIHETAYGVGRRVERQAWENASAHGEVYWLSSLDSPGQRAKYATLAEVEYMLGEWVWAGCTPVEKD